MTKEEKKQLEQLEWKVEKLESDINFLNSKIQDLIPQAEGGKITNGTISCEKVNLVNIK